MDATINSLFNKFTFDEQLILEVQAHPILYNKTLPEYKNRNKVSEAWSEIEFVLEAPLEQIKKRWKNLKDTFRSKSREMSLTPSGSAGGKKKLWLYYNKMMFLLPYIQIEETESNYTSNESAPENGARNEVSDNPSESDENAEFTVPDAKRRTEEEKERKKVTNKILKALDNLEKDVPTSKDAPSSIKLFFDSLAAKAEKLDEYQQSILEMTCLEAYQSLKFPPEALDENHFE